MVNIIARAFGVCAVVLAFGSNAVLAAPTQAQAQGNCISTLPGNFTLTALNTTLSNVNSTGIPLLAAGIQSDHSGRTYQLVTRGAWPYSDSVPNFTLKDNGLMAKGTSDYASGYALYSGSPVSFAQAISSAPIVVAQPIYCAVPPINPGGRYRLVAKDSAPKSLWKICPSSFITSVVYNATKDGSNYKLADCFDVDLYLNPSTSA